MARRDLIVEVMLKPELLHELSMLDWDLLIRQGRRANLLARLAYKMTQNGSIDAVPTAPRRHLKSALQMAQRQDIALRWEVECIQKALKDTNTKLVLLKGAAYAMAGLAAAKGRTFSDIDIIVPKNKLGQTESELMIHGWHGSHNDIYDQRYYRQWMHEIPPMRHIKRGTTIDVHHAILPETARVKVNTEALMQSVIPLLDQNNIYILQPTDMFLHSATHLFHEGDFEKGLRDLFDLDSLAFQFGANPGFWELLVPRAVTLGLTRPLYYALRYSSVMLDTTIPTHVLDASKIGRPVYFVAKLMDLCYFRALRSTHASSETSGVWLAHFVLYVRSHWIRMPAHLLVYHLGRKAFMRTKNNDEKPPEVKPNLK